MGGANVVIEVQRLVTDDSCELRMHRLVIVVVLADSTAKLNRFERVRVIEALEACNNVWVLAHNPDGRASTRSSRRHQESKSR